MPFFIFSPFWHCNFFNVLSLCLSLSLSLHMSRAQHALTARLCCSASSVCVAVTAVSLVPFLFATWTLLWAFYF